MSFVTQLNIKEFRGIKECKEPLKFSKFNVLIGRNNSGKSAVLQAFSLLPHYGLDQPMDLRAKGVTNRFGFVAKLIGGSDSLIYRYAGKTSLDFEFGEKKYCINFNGTSWKSIIEDKEIDISKACEYLDVKLEEGRNWTVFIPNESEFLGKVEEKLSSEWKRVEKSESPIKVTKEVINPIIDEVFTEVLRRNHGLYVRKEVEGKPFYVNVRDLGDGIEKTLNILLFLDSCAPKLVLWDDFEISAHPSLVKRLLQWLNEKEWQVVIATHSIDVLYELVEIKPKDALIIQLRKTGDDILTYETLTVEEVEDYLSAGNDPRLLVDLVE